MSFWLYTFLCDLIVPVVMILGGRVMKHHPSLKMNKWIGYRTSLSMENEEMWQYAQKYSGQLWWKIGWWMLIPTILLHFPFVSSTRQCIENVSLVIVCIHLIVLLLTVVLTQKALKTKSTHHE